MRKPMRMLAIVAIFGGTAATFAQTAEKPSIVGTWTAQDAGAKAAIVFKADGTFTRTLTTAKGSQTDKGTYKIAGDVLLVEPEGEEGVIAVKFKFLTPEKLHLTVPDEDPVTLDRATDGGTDEPDEPEKPVVPLVKERPVRKTRTYQPPEPLLAGEKPLWCMEIHGLEGHVDADGKVRVEPQFEAAGEFEEGLAYVRLNGKYGFIDRTGRLVVEAKYEDVGGFSDGLTWVKVGGKYGFIDKAGKVVIEPKYHWAIAFGDGLGGVWIDGKWGFIDKTGKMVIEAKFDGARAFHEGLAAVKVAGKWGFIDRNGKQVIETKFDRVGSFREGLIPAREARGDPMGYLDKTGKWAIDPAFAEAGEFRENRAKVKKDDKRGFIDRTGKMVIPATLAWAGEFSEGLAAIDKLGNDQYAYIDMAGKQVLKIDCEFAHDFHNGRARIELHGLDGLIDRKGKILFDPLPEIRDWADLKRAKGSGLYGGGFEPIPVKNRTMAERYLNSLRDTRKRPLYYEFVREFKKYNEPHLLFNTVDRHGRERKLTFVLKAAAKLANTQSPEGLFLVKTEPKPQ